MSTATRGAVLLVGGAGYIGSHTAKRLARDGFRPVVYDNLSEGRAEFVRWGPLEIGELHDSRRLKEVVRRHAPRAVLHFAAHAVVPESIEHPSRYYGNNVTGTLGLLDAMRSAGVCAFVFSSTCAVYGNPAKVPIPEAAPLLPVNPYGRSKRMVEDLLEDYDAAYGLRSVSLRYFNAAGADLDGELGEWRRTETHLIPRALDAAAGRLEGIEVFGADYPTPDGTCIRDYIHVEDLAEAHARAVRHLLEGGPSLRLNLGTGSGHSVREVIAAVERVTGRRVPVTLRPRRAGDPPVLVADPTRARDAWGWAPRVPGILGIVESAWEWRRRCLTREGFSCL